MLYESALQQQLKESTECTCNFTSEGNETVKTLHIKCGIPAKDEISNANRVNLIFENFIVKQPSHYFWVHKKFKRRPEGLVDVYAGI